MAASSKIGGYQCEFVGTVSEDFVCGLCKHVAREPHVTSCCSETFCQVCITSIIEDKKPCPSCETVEFSTLFIVKYQRRILAIEVHCTMKDRGCEWTGKLEGLEAHLDVNTGDCECIDVECPNKCNEPVEKHNLPTHLANSCPKREFTCQYCNFKATYEVVSNDHWPQCSFYPVPCPNACGIHAIERGDLEAHFLQCPLEVVECDFSHAGCNTKLPRQDLEKHLEENIQKHLTLVSIMSLNTQQQLQQRNKELKEQLKEQKQQIEAVEQEAHQQIRALEEKQRQELQNTSQDFEKKLKERDCQISCLQKTTQENEAKIRDLKLQLQQKAQQVEGLERCMGVGICSLKFEMPDFNQHKCKTATWFSPPVYADIGKYKFCIAVESGGSHSGPSTHVAIYLCSMQDEYDSQLLWPAKWTITLQLLNQERDQDHVTVTKSFQWNKSSGEIIGLRHFSTKFIAHKDLEYNAQKQTCYLKNDCLLFQVAKAKWN